MENRVAVVQYQANSPIEDTYSCEQVTNLEGYFISVFDGHGGWQLCTNINITSFRNLYPKANYARENLSHLFKNALSSNLQNSASQPTEQLIIKSIQDSYKALEKSYYDIASKSYKLGFHQMGRVGSCALSTFLHENKLYVANLGDCKAILIKSEKSGVTAQKLTHKFNANSKKEQARLRAKFPDDKEIVVCRRVLNFISHFY